MRGVQGRLGAAAYVELAVEVVDVGLDGAQGDEKLARDLLVRLSAREQPQHLGLSLG